MLSPKPRSMAASQWHQTLALIEKALAALSNGAFSEITPTPISAISKRYRPSLRSELAYQSEHKVWLCHLRSPASKVAIRHFTVTIFPAASD